ncbi:MAG: hypothetical protein UU24_C0007G0004 [Candidatus Nomurabacteria bacterium GW2011_GWA2_40_9]|uniref:EamA domain-containing protein n=1 Tax=Candidatus Nomurabacteria bacterium GW2011_GWA2_40_9 TaxID=1618734 RepID=A0A0G0WVM9_9BACT|nr:MAG: hypothetical protein UU24_C0007G0004 [Candidatus Nomurabacteria bacterium GW2011_GWA2_40_9]
MNWFLIALVAPFLWAVVNIIDQYLIKKYTDNNRKSTGALVLFSSLIGLFFASLILFFANDVLDISMFDKLLLIASGVLTICWVIFYMFAIRIEHISSVVPWFLAVPVFGYVLGYFFFGETLALSQQIGSLIIFLGVLLLSLDFSNKGHTNFKWKVGLYMIPSCFLIALIGVIFKYVTIDGNFWVSSFWEYIGLGISGVFIYLFIPSYRVAFLQMIKIGRVKIFSLNFASEVISSIGNVLTNYAILLAPVVMVFLVGSFQPAILLILTIICTKFFPKIATENLSQRVLIPKIVSILVIILGSMVLFI